MKKGRECEGGEKGKQKKINFWKKEFFIRGWPGGGRGPVQSPFSELSVGCCRKEDRDEGEEGKKISVRRGSRIRGRKEPKDSIFLGRGT